MFDLNLKIAEDMFTNFGSTINHHQTVCKEKKKNISAPTFLMELCPFVILNWQMCPLLYENLVPSMTLNAKGVFMKLVHMFSII